MSDGPRELEEDHDVLTIMESGLRLRNEIVEARAELVRLEKSPPDDHAHVRVEAARHRLDLLLQAQLRNAGQVDAAGRKAGFLTYRPSPAPPPS
jgi:hypothetical protein